MAPLRSSCSQAAADTVVVIGAGIGGLAATMDLARQGKKAIVVDPAPSVGGKMRTATVAGRAVDCGPTVLTMRHVFDDLFDAAGGDFAALGASRLALIARHIWPGGETLDLPACRLAAADAIGTFAGAAAAQQFRAFSAYSERLFAAAAPAFLFAPRPTVRGVLARVGVRGLGDVCRIDAVRTMDRALRSFFADRRLVQLFGRYATYCGGAPTLAPATYNLVAHVEHQGVWRLPGGMAALARAMWALAARHGAELRANTAVRQILVEGGAAAGVVLSDGSTLRAGAVVLSCGPEGLAALLRPGGADADPPGAPRGDARPALSAHTYAAVGTLGGAALAMHNVLFAAEPGREFDAIFGAGHTPTAGTLYLCAQDRDGLARPAGVGERAFFLANAPSTAAEETYPWAEKLATRLPDYGLSLHIEAATATTPRDFARRFPAERGAIYGRPPHSLAAILRRSGSLSRLPGVYLCGGSVHPGPGVPMTALSGRLAAAALLQRSASTSTSRPVATPGGTSMPRAPTAASR